MVDYLELIYGSMYSGKTEELLRRLRRCTFANKKFQLFKPSIDDRYSSTDVVTHDNAIVKNKVEKIVSVYIDDEDKNYNSLQAKCGKPTLLGVGWIA